MRGAQRRSALLDAAVDAVRRCGPDASMEDIAAEGAVTKPILYRHFGDRGGLVEAVGERVLTNVMGELRAALNRPAGVREVIATTVGVWVDFVEREPAVYRFLVDGDALVRQVGGDIVAVLADYLRAERMDPEAAGPWAFGIVGMVHMAAEWWSGTRSMSRDQLVAHLTDLLWGGLSPDRR